MYKKLLSISMAIFLLVEVKGQQQVKVPHKSLLEAKNSIELQAIYEQNIKAELTYAKEVLGLNIDPQILLDGTVIQLVGVSENGIPKYIKTDNAGAAKTIGTDKVHPGGSLGFNLSGSGMTNRIGIWDGGAVRVSHQEFQGRAVQTDGTTTLSDHATHVAGTMIAGGVQANAKGMSFQAPLKCYFWDNDVSEMNTAAGSGMLVSNHSYGSVCGWNYDDANTQWRWYGDVSLSSTEDYKFGLYNDDAQAWDQTVYNNPFYLPFKSAGNDRGDVPSTAATRVYFNSNTGNWVPFSGATPPADGQYDCISTNGVAKNILTIGAVNKITNGWNGASSVVMSSFSGWGPTDDGRIKPDICAAGVDLYSSYSGNNTAYSSISGTSMASPNASGSALLIQQHYNNLKGKFLRASSLKGLIIHTADEAGSNPGPDYSFGWGLMNTAKAVQSISDSGANQIIESQIPTDLTPFVKTVVSNGTVPLKITLCWTDIAATASSSNVFDDQVAKLINDLDVRVVRVSDNQQFLPYILNPATPNAAATNGDNFRDNVEQIFIAAPSAGAYSIKVSSKRGFPNNLSQSFSLIIGGISPKPAANFSASAQMSCVGSQITFTNNSSSSNTAIWYFPGGSPSTSSSANPVVTYSAAGNYPVALKVTGVSGEDSLYKLDYIKIGGLTLPVIETFESNSQTANLWRVGNIYNDTFSFRKWTNALGTAPGNTVVGLNLYDNPNLTRRYQLFSPILDLRGMQNANLSFQHAYSRYDGTSKDSLIVSISSNCGSTWTRLLGMTENRPNNGSKMATYTGVGDPAQTSQFTFVPSLPADWCSTNINSTPCNSIGLNSFVGLNNVIIRFEVYYGGGNNLFLDNINITGTPFSPKAGFKVPSLVCANQNTVFTDTSLNNPSTWNWVVTGPQNVTATNKNPSFNFSSTGLYTVKLKVSNVSGSDSVTVTNSIEVKASPAKPAVSLSGSLILCNNDSSLLTTTSSNLQWYRDSVAIVGEINSNYYNKNAGKIAVRTMGSNGCSAQSDLYTFSTGTNPPVPTITKSLAGNQFCEGGSFTLTSSATSANTWMRNGVNMPGQTASTLNFNDSGTFNVKVSNGVCSSISVPLTISKLPRPNTSDITASKFAYKNDTASYWVNGLPTSSYNWTVSGGIIQSGQNTNNIVVKWSTGTNGVIQVTEKGTNGCNGVLKTYPVGIWNTAVSNVSNNNDFILFPNPTNQFININYLGSTIDNLNITVFDMLGKKVLSQDINLNNNNQQVLDLVNLAKGVYIIKLVSDNFSGSKIITKE